MIYTVKELIEKLQGFNPDYQVDFEGSCNWPEDEFSDVILIENDDKKRVLIFAKN